MTLHETYKILLNNEKNYDYDFDFPNLQGKTVNLVSKNLTNIIYKSLKQKSSSSNQKRINILKFINSTCEVKDTHIDRSAGTCLDLIQKSFKNPDEEELAHFKSECDDEIQNRNHYDISDTLNKHYELKKRKYRRKLKHLEFIKREDQKCLDLKYNLHARSISYYNASDDVLKKFLVEKSTENLKCNVSTPINQPIDLIKLSYATMNLMTVRIESAENIVFQKILQKLSCSPIPFNKYEQNFLRYSWNTDSKKITMFMERFFFLIEQIIIKHSTAILSLTSEIDICQYFVDLEDDPGVIKIRNVCREDKNVYLKLKSSLYELYYLSFCNGNVLKLCDLII